MRRLLLLMIISLAFNSAESQICGELSGWTFLSDNGDGTCTYGVSVTVDSGNGASGTATFSIDGSTVFVESNCTCNPTTVTFPVTISCGSTVNIAVDYNAPGMGNDCSSNTGDIALPVEWVSLSVFKSENSNSINWSVIEQDNSKFIVERSNGGLLFDEIGELTGKGASDHIENYSYLDLEPNSGINYYRVKQIDFDNSISYSEIVSINNKMLGDISIYPNPFYDLVKIESDDIKSWKLLNLLGGTVMMGDETEIAVDQVMPGVYYLQVVDNAENIYLEKLVKQ